MAATTVSTPLYPAYADQFGLTPLVITVVFAVYGVGVMGGLAVTGRLSDHIGRKPPLAAGLVIGLAAMALFIAAHGLALLLAGRLLIGVTAGSTRAPRRRGWSTSAPTARGPRSSRLARTWAASRSVPPSPACSRSSRPNRCGRST